MDESPSIPDFLFEVLRCPHTRSRLTLGDDSLLARLNAAIRARELKNESGEFVAAELEGVLINAEHSFAYPIRRAIPVMLAGEAISFASFPVPHAQESDTDP